MKLILSLSIYILTIGLFAQISDSIGIDDNPFLNKTEVELLNSLLNETRTDFNFTDKKVAFITGSNGGKIVSKSDFFRNTVIPWIEKNSKPQIFMVKLTEDEKLKSGGYDVLVLSWVKVFIPKTQEKVINKLKNELIAQNQSDSLYIKSIDSIRQVRRKQNFIAMHRQFKDTTNQRTVVKSFDNNKLILIYYVNDGLAPY